MTYVTPVPSLHLIFLWHMDGADKNQNWPMRAGLQKWWSAGKILCTLAILVLLGKQFFRDLQTPGLWDISLRPVWLLLSAIFYIAGLGFSALFWYRLLWRLGQEPFPWKTIRAYYLGLMGKYLPGKAWALLLRAALIRGPRVDPGYAGLTALYEVLTTMASGSLLAALVFTMQAPHQENGIEWNDMLLLLTLRQPASHEFDRRLFIFFSIFLLLLVGLPTLPRPFNWLVTRLSVTFRGRDPNLIPKVTRVALAEGIVLTSCVWLLFGASLWANLQGLLPSTQPLTWSVWASYTSFLAVAYVSGFVILLIPSGLGVREYFLTLFLVPELGHCLGQGEEITRAFALLAVLVLRLVWTGAELVVAAVLYCIPGQPEGSVASLSDPGRSGGA